MGVWTQIVITIIAMSAMAIPMVASGRRRMSARQSTAGACPDLVAVPVDESFLLNDQPKEGFYAPLSSGENGLPNYVAQPMPEPEDDSVKICNSAEILMNGNVMMTSPGITCSGPSYSDFMCVRPETGSIKTLVAMGIQVPKVVHTKLVETDNSTYVAMGACIDGAQYMWAILTTAPEHWKNAKQSTLDALHVTGADVKEQKNKKFKPGRTTIEAGDCSASDN